MAARMFARPRRIVNVVVLLFAFQFLVGKAGHVVAGWFDYTAWDPYNVFASNWVHHMVMLAVALVVIALLHAAFKVEFHGGWGDKALGMKYVLVFTTMMASIAIATHVFLWLGGNLPTYGYPLRLGPVVGNLAFQLFLSGPAEELLYRMLPIPLLAWAIGPTDAINWKIPPHVVVAALLFACAHMKWTFSPFAVQADLMTVVYAGAMGIIQGIAYQRCGSIVYPMMLHSFSNVLMVGTGYVFTAWFA